MDTREVLFVFVALVGTRRCGRGSAAGGGIRWCPSGDHIVLVLVVDEFFVVVGAHCRDQGCEARRRKLEGKAGEEVAVGERKEQRAGRRCSAPKWTRRFSRNLVLGARTPVTPGTVTSAFGAFGILLPSYSNRSAYTTRDSLGRIGLYVFLRICSHGHLEPPVLHEPLPPPIALMSWRSRTHSGRPPGIHDDPRPVRARLPAD